MHAYIILASTRSHSRVTTILARKASTAHLVAARNARNAWGLPTSATVNTTTLEVAETTVPVA